LVKPLLLAKPTVG
jgi:hypothetical protein